ncbi:MAG TPA: hypothetical protein ENH95_02930 [Nitrosopumilus sp.]|nr:hypothetical protein [Nitrosopumilus sp.]
MGTLIDIGGAILAMLIVIILLTLLVGGLLLFISWILMIAWNTTLPHLFGINQISLVQSFWLFVLAHILFTRIGK